MRLDFQKRRKELGLTLEDIGNMVGVSKSTVKKWENGYIKNMRRDKILSLAKALQVSPIDILDSADPSDPPFCSKKTVSSSLAQYKDFIKNVFGCDATENVIVYNHHNNVMCYSLSENTFSAIIDILESTL